MFIFDVTSEIKNIFQLKVMNHCAMLYVYRLSSYLGWKVRINIKQAVGTHVQFMLVQIIAKKNSYGRNQCVNCTVRYMINVHVLFHADYM
jgi:hypothetical protein